MENTADANKNEIERVRDYYNQGPEREWTRLDRHPVEYEISKRHIESVLADNSRIADIGGGPGKYSVYFASKGHRLTLVDLSAENISYGRGRAADAGVVLEDCICSSVADLSALEQGAFDAVLCMGPLYHLTAEEHRNAALQNIRRVLKPKGRIMAAFLSPFSHAISALKRSPELITQLKEEYEFIIRNSRNAHPERLDFTYAWYPDPKKIEQYMAARGYKMLKLAAVESLGWTIEGNIAGLSDRARRDWLDYFYRISTDPSLLGAAQHLLYIGMKKA